MEWFCIDIKITVIESIYIEKKRTYVLLCECEWFE